MAGRRTTKAANPTDEVMAQETVEEVKDAAIVEENTAADKAEKPQAKRGRKAKANEEAQPTEIEFLRAQIEALKEQLAATASAPVKAVLMDSEEKVHLLWQAPVAEDNMLLIGENGMYGRIIGQTGSAFIPKNELSRVLDSAMRSYIDMRWMIVVSGLNEEEKESLGVNYKEGEILDKKAFEKMVDLGDQMLEIYPDLCDEHKAIVAKKFYEAYNNHKHIKRELVVELNKIKPDAAFKKIIEKMNESELKTE